MTDFFSDCSIDVNILRRALTYLIIWHWKGIPYRVPDNGVVKSPGTKYGEDKGGYGSVSSVDNWYIRPSSSLLKRSNIFNKGGRIRKIPLSKLYTLVRAEDFNLVTPIIGGRRVIAWSNNIKEFLRLDDTAVCSDRELATFMLIVARILCDIVYFQRQYQHSAKKLRQSRK
jgi:hypothetical protein